MATESRLPSSPLPPIHCSAAGIPSCLPLVRPLSVRCTPTPRSTPFRAMDTTRARAPGEGQGWGWGWGWGWG